MEHRVECEIGGEKLVMSTGRIAKQADGAVMLQYGGTVVFAAAVSSPPRFADQDFFPLTVDYREKTYAAGKIPGGFKKREGPPSTRETLTARLIDRPMRPLFPEGYFNEVGLSTQVLSSDKENLPDILALVAASAATCISTIPFNGPIGGVRVGKIDGQLVINPTHSELKTSTLDIIVTGSREATVMIEGSAKELPEAEVLEALAFGQSELQKLIDIQNQLIEMCGKAKQEVAPSPFDENLFAEIREAYTGRAREAMSVQGKFERKDALKAVKTEIVERYIAEENPRSTPAEISAFWERIVYRVIRDITLDGRRVDGRAYDELRDIECSVSELPRTHGSALFQRGETQALATVTLGSRRDEQRVDGLEEDYFSEFMLHYNFPAFSVGETWANRGPKRREIGHGALAERSIEGVLPDPEDFPYTIRVVSDIMESNGSSSMASVCGATLCLMDAGVPIKHPVAGISIGLVKEGDRWETLTDILGEEDHYCDMDFKIAGSQVGITGIQLDIKIDGLTPEIIEKAVAQGREARIQILRTMMQTIDRPREDVPEHAPKLTAVQINPDKIGKVIGPGGKTINGIQDETGATIEIDDDNSGRITLFGPNRESVAMAEEAIKRLTEEAEVGRIYEGRVTSVKDFGCFVEILPGTEGLVHVSELSSSFVKSVEDFVKLGDAFPVKVVSVDNQGRIRLSKKEAEAAQKN